MRCEPLKVDGPRLALNVDTAVLGSLRAGLLDADGKAIEGFGLEDGEVIRTNSTHALAGWKGGADLSSLRGREVRLTFTGARARLYSFFFSSDTR